VHRAPIVHVELPPAIGEGHVEPPSVDGNGGAVDPGIETAEFRDGAVGHRADLRDVADIADLKYGAARLGLNGVDRFGEIVLVARREHHPGSFARGALRRHQSDPARCADDHDRLLAERLELSLHM
jgi:hypothetical protein